MNVVIVGPSWFPRGTAATAPIRNLALGLAAVASRPDRGAAIGYRGREAGVRAFDRKTHPARLLDFAAGLRAGSPR